MAHIKVELRYTTRACLAFGHAVQDLAFTRAEVGSRDVVADLDLLAALVRTGLALDDFSGGREGAGDNESDGRGGSNRDGSNSSEERHCEVVVC